MNCTSMIAALLFATGGPDAAAVEPRKHAWADVAGIQLAPVSTDAGLDRSAKLAEEIALGAWMGNVRDGAQQESAPAVLAVSRHLPYPAATERILEVLMDAKIVIMRTQPIKMAEPQLAVRLHPGALLAANGSAVTVWGRF